MRLASRILFHASGLTIRIVASLLLLLCLAVSNGGAGAQEATKKIREQIVGTWMLTSIYDEYQDGRKTYPWGADVKAMLIFDNTGHFSWQIFGSNRPKFAANNRREGTAEENKAAVQETQSYFGTYVVNEQDSAVALHIERSLFPNWDGARQKRSVSFKDNEMRYVADPIPSSGGKFVPHLIFKRAN